MMTKDNFNSRREYLLTLLNGIVGQKFEFRARNDKNQLVKVYLYGDIEIIKEKEVRLDPNLQKAEIIVKFLPEDIQNSGLQFNLKSLKNPTFRYKSEIYYIFEQRRSSFDDMYYYYIGRTA